MQLYDIYIQYQCIHSKHRYGESVYVRAKNAEDAISYAVSLPHNTDYVVRKCSVVKEIHVHEVNYNK